MSSKALSKFKKTIVRCESLVEIYKTLHTQSQTDGRVSASQDIVRGAVVLSVAALDAYVTDVFCEKLVTYLKRYGADQSLVDLLQKAGLDTREALTLISMERPYRRIHTLMRQYYQSYTTQRFNVIDSIFLPFRLEDITSNAVARSGKPSIKKSVATLVERRHEIAHDGDYNSHGRIKTIEANRIAKRIKHLEVLVINLDAIICNRI